MHTTFQPLTWSDFRHLRRATGQTLRRVAAQSGISVSRLSERERSSDKITIDAALLMMESLVRLAEAKDVPRLMQTVRRARMRIAKEKSE